MARAKKRPVARKGPKKRRASTPKEPPHKNDKIDVSADPYRGRGRPRLYEQPEELETEIDKYFVWILGERRMRKVKQQVYNKHTRKWSEKVVEEEYWHRLPERPARTGLVLFIGFASHESLRKQGEVSQEFKAVVTRGLARVEHAYENGLWERDSARGSQFALSNMGWKNRTDTQQLDRDGKPIDPVPAAVISVTHLAEAINKV